MFYKELLSDVKFVVRDSENGCQSMRTISSPVFYAMFYGELAEKKESIDISDCDHKSLLELFSFAYSDKAKLISRRQCHARVVFGQEIHASFPRWFENARSSFEKTWDASDVFHVLPAAQKYEEKDLENHCWDVIDNETDEAVKSDGFVTIEKSVLEELVDRESLNVREVELFKAVDCWATKECEK